MKPLIAISGKGGTGKSTLTALLVQQLVAMGTRPVLGVDADPNCCLAELLGVALPGTIAELRESTRRQESGRGDMPKVMQLELGLNELMAEGLGFDVMTMGRPEGPGCYCYVNGLLGDLLKRTGRGYAAMVIDNQAGMEHLSRLVTAKVDTLLLVSEPSVPAARAVVRILELSRSLPMDVGRRIVVWNRVTAEGVPPEARRVIDTGSADEFVEIPWEARLATAYATGKGIRLESDAMPAVARLAELCRGAGSSAAHT